MESAQPDEHPPVCGKSFFSKNIFFISQTHILGEFLSQFSSICTSFENETSLLSNTVKCKLDKLTSFLKDLKNHYSKDKLYCILINAICSC